MRDEDTRLPGTAPSNSQAEPQDASRKAWETPRMTFVQPKLVRHGTLQRLTGGFFGTFAPPP